MNVSSDVFHPGELAIQSRARVPEYWREKAASFIREEMLEEHRDFFRSQSVVFLGALDLKGRAWATLAHGSAGFITTPSSQQMNILSPITMADQLDLDLSKGARIGVLGIDLTSRRRNRMNGTIGSPNQVGLEIVVDQSFGNCPQYIQNRIVDWATPVPLVQEVQIVGPQDMGAQEIFGAADTFFIASRATEHNESSNGGVDISHRGGRPGFLQLSEAGVISFPDFSGNRFFNTLGNIQSDGRVGLLVPDFQSGSAVFVTGRATIDWSSQRLHDFQGAERIVDVVADEIVLVKSAFPKYAQLVDVWPGLRRTGTWSSLSNPAV